MPSILILGAQTSLYISNKIRNNCHWSESDGILSPIESGINVAKQCIWDAFCPLGPKGLFK